MRGDCCQLQNVDGGSRRDTIYCQKPASQGVVARHRYKIDFGQPSRSGSITSQMLLPYIVDGSMAKALHLILERTRREAGDVAHCWSYIASIGLL